MIWDFPGDKIDSSVWFSAGAHRFSYDVVYSNVMSAGAYRGYGATQGIFAVESAVNEMVKTGIHRAPCVRMTGA